MSSDKDLQEMEVKTQQSKTAVNAGASAADPMDTSVVRFLRGSWWSYSRKF